MVSALQIVVGKNIRRTRVLRELCYRGAPLSIRARAPVFVCCVSFLNDYLRVDRPGPYVRPPAAQLAPSSAHFSGAALTADICVSSMRSSVYFFFAFSAPAAFPALLSRFAAPSSDDALVQLSFLMPPFSGPSTSSPHHEPLLSTRQQLWLLLTIFLVILALWTQNALKLFRQNLPLAAFPSIVAPPRK
ncbi:hypothetical protein FB451DRAFT_1405910 [Mycena latifolia]|nr:hypothetical protein FB451DRAFT_1405910 [Mycena latifolia]